MNILVVDDEKIQRESLVGFLKKINHTVYEANSAQAALSVPGRLYGFEISNPNSADAYIQFFDVV